LTKEFAKNSGWQSQIQNKEFIQGAGKRQNVFGQQHCNRAGITVSITNQTNNQRPLALV
jgi:hypothetical protein